MISSSIVGLLGLSGGRVATASTSAIVYGVVAGYTLNVVPLFVLIVVAMWKGGVAARPHSAARQWMSWMPGGLTVATTFSGAPLSQQPAEVPSASPSCPPACRCLRCSPGGTSCRSPPGGVTMAGTLGPIIPPGILLPSMPASSPFRWAPATRRRRARHPARRRVHLDHRPLGDVPAICGSVFRRRHTWKSRVASLPR